MSKLKALLFTAILLCATGIIGAGGNKETALRSLIIASTEDLIGIPYKQGGSDLSGFSSTGLTKYIYSKVHINLPNDPATMFANGKQLHPKDARAGDLIFFKYSGSQIDYVAIYLGKKRFIHASPQDGKVIISIISQNNIWGQKYAGVCTYQPRFAGVYGKLSSELAAAGNTSESDLGNDSVSAKTKDIVNTDIYKEQDDSGKIMAIPANQKDLRKSLLNTASLYLGVPYLWGGTSPDGFDCSGLVQFVYQKNGLQLPRTSGEQYRAGSEIHPKEALPGDLIFFYGEVRGRVAHVVMYVGKGQFIHAPSTGKTVSYSTIKKEQYWGKRFQGVCTFIK